MSVVLRAMGGGDVDAVAAIEASSFTTPWKAETFHALLARPGAVLLVADEDGTVIGYSVLWCILDQGEIANIALIPERRGRGLGRALLRRNLDEARARGVCSLFLEVRESNHPARRLYAAEGFREIGVRRGYYDSPKEDARVLQIDLTASTDTTPADA